MIFLNKVLVFYTSILLPNLIIGQNTPSISYITQEQIKNIGDSVELKCSVQNANDYAVVWTKTGRDRANSVFLSTGSVLIINDSRFSLQYDPSPSTYTLQIKDMQETDAGVYECQVILSVTNQIKAEVDVRVRYPPIISDNSTQSIVANEGQFVQMECFADGFPTPTIQWRRENNAELPTGGSTYSGNVIKINSVRKEDRGTYYCVADNGVSKRDKRNVNLVVQFAPVITVPRPRLGQALKYDMNLECHIEAYPTPSILWVKDETQLSNNQHFSISDFAISNEFIDSTIRIITVEKGQYGDYYCRAVNKMGQAEAKVNLFETINPVCPPACSPSISYVTQEQTKNVGGSAELMCSVHNPKDYSIYWTKRGRDDTDTVYLSYNSNLIIKDLRFSIHKNTSEDSSLTTYTLQIKDMNKNDSGVYQCVIVITIINKITADVIVRVKTPSNSTAPSISYITQEQIKDIGDSVELKCFIENLSDYSVLWSKKLGPSFSDSEILSTGSALIKKDSRFSIQYDSSSSTYTLQINDMNENDAGVYQCVILLSVVNRITADVIVRIKPTPPTISHITQEQTIDIGDSVELQCSVQNLNEDYSVLWVRKGSDYRGTVYLSAGSAQIIKDSRFSIHQNTSDNPSLTIYTLQIKDINETDGGVYECVIAIAVSNKITARADVNIHVRPPPQKTPSISYITQNQTKDIGDSVELQCSVKHAISYGIFWTKIGNNGADSRVVSIGNALIITDSRFSSRYDSSSSTYTLQIKNIRETDGGTYQCMIFVSLFNKIIADVNIRVRPQPIV